MKARERLKILFVTWSIYDENIEHFSKNYTGGGVVIKNICEYVGRKCDAYLFIGKCVLTEMNLGHIHIVGTETDIDIQNEYLSPQERHLQIMTKKFVYTIKKIKPDIVNIHGLGVLAKRCIEICIELNVPYAYTEHLFIGNNQEIEGYEKHIQWESNLYSLPDIKIITVGTRMKKKVLECYPHISPQNISVILNGTDFIAQRIQSDLRKKHRIFNEKVLLCVGTISYRKNQMQIVEAFQCLPPAFQNCIKILFCGVDTIDGKLQSKISKTGLEDKLVYVGAVSNKEMKEYYSIADGLVVPSKAEGLSIAMLETIAYGLPVVMFADSECAEDLNDNNVVCFADDRSSQGLAEAMKKWYQREWDHNYIMQYSKYFSMERMAADYIKYYKSRLLS